MIRSGRIARAREQSPHLDLAEVEAVVNAVLTRIGDALAADDRVELRGLGVFSAVGRRPTLQGMPRPRTGDLLPHRPPERPPARCPWVRADP